MTDLADAHILSLNYLQDRGKSNAFNLGNGNGFSVKEVIETSKKVTGREIKAIEWERMEGDPDVLIGSFLKAVRLLNWQPKFNNLDTIIQTAWEWQKKQI